MTKIEAATREYSDWSEAIGIDTVGKLREVMEAGRAVPLINLCEARQERKYAEIANQIFWKKDECRVVMLSGPSSSGKTSSSLRIAQQCRVLGLSPRVIELDNYFVDRDRNPRLPDGRYDFESLAAMDVELLSRHISALLSGEQVELPRYDFPTGRRVFEGRKMRLGDSDILIMEGIHALNPALTPDLDPSEFFKIYVSALSVLKGENGPHDSSSDKRLLRRIVRDNRTRGISPEDNMLRWPDVRQGELKNIFPFRENADVVFNSSSLYDLPLLKHYAEPLLKQIPSTSKAFDEAQNLIGYMTSVIPLSDKDIAAIPPTSIMREFIGGQMLY